MTRLAANAASFWQPVSPQIWVLPAASARWAWTTATSGLSGGTAYTGSPPNGEVTGRMLGLTLGRSVSKYDRSGQNGSLAAPAAYRPTIPKWLYSSSSRGAGSWCSTRRRMACSDPTPGLPIQEKTSLAATPAPIIWS